MANREQSITTMHI